MRVTTRKQYVVWTAGLQQAMTISECRHGNPSSRLTTCLPTHKRLADYQYTDHSVALVRPSADYHGTGVCERGSGEINLTLTNFLIFYDTNISKIFIVVNHSSVCSCRKSDTDIITPAKQLIERQIGERVQTIQFEAIEQVEGKIYLK